MAIPTFLLCGSIQLYVICYFHLNCLEFWFIIIKIECIQQINGFQCHIYYVKQLKTYRIGNQRTSYSTRLLRQKTINLTRTAMQDYSFCETRNLHYLHLKQLMKPHYLCSEVLQITHVLQMALPNYKAFSATSVTNL